MPHHNRTPPPPLERHLLQQVQMYLKVLQGHDRTLVFRKRHGSLHAVAGDPDLYGVWNGVPFEIELKPVGKNPTPLQAQRLEEWRASGALVFVVHSLHELQAALHRIRAAQPSVSGKPSTT